MKPITSIFSLVTSLNNYLKVDNVQVSFTFEANEHKYLVTVSWIKDGFTQKEAFSIISNRIGTVYKNVGDEVYELTYNWVVRNRK